LPCGKLWAIIAFYFCNLFVYWSGWDIIFKFEIAVLLGFLFLVTQHFKTEKTLDWKQSIWLWVYFIGLGIISYLGNFGGGLGWLHFGMDFVVIAIFSVFIAWFALRCRLPAARTEAYIEALQVETR